MFGWLSFCKKAPDPVPSHTNQRLLPLQWQALHHIWPMIHLWCVIRSTAVHWLEQEMHRCVWLSEYVQSSYENLASKSTVHAPCRHCQIPRVQRHFTCPFSLFRIESNLAFVPSTSWTVKVWKFPPCANKCISKAIHLSQWTECRVPPLPPPATFVITLNKQPLSPPVHEAFRRWTEENSRVSEYLGQHGILDLSENTRLSLSPSLTHSHKHTTTHTPHTHTVVVNTQLACSRVQMVYNLQPSKRNWAAPVSWNLSPSSCFKC